MFDLLIKNGRIVDGSGAPAYFGDVAVQGERIAAVEAGMAGDKAKKVIDATGHVVAPGFIDIHTHYDAQMLWDPLCTSSSWHGNTTVVAGNCGFTIAPCRPEDRDYITSMLSVVEEIPLPALQQGINWSWETFPEYLTAIEQLPKAVNFGCFVGHSAVRRYVMGSDFRRAANEGEISAMQSLVTESLRAGALGFSTSRIPNHVDGEGKPVPSFYAEMPELLAFSRALRQVDRGLYEITPKLISPKGEYDTGDLPDLVALAKESRRPVTWATVRYLPSVPKRAEHILSEVTKAAREEGVRLYPQIGCRPFDDFMSWKRLMRIFANLPTWREVMFSTTEKKIHAFSQPALRSRMRTELATATLFNGWQYVLVHTANHPEEKKLEGLSIANIASRRGKDPLDVFLDISVADKCETEFLYAIADTDDGPLGRMLKDPNTLLATDAGAHLSSICNADFPSFILAHWVRETGILSLEQAVNLFTGRPANALGLHDRGCLRTGLNADIVVFDPDTISGGTMQTVHDMPAASSRLIQKSKGIREVIINGQVVLSENKHTGALPGRLARGM